MSKNKKVKWNVSITATDGEGKLAVLMLENVKGEWLAFCIEDIDAMKDFFPRIITEVQINKSKTYKGIRARVRQEFADLTT